MTLSSAYSSLKANYLSPTQFMILPITSNTVNPAVSINNDGKIHLLKLSPRNCILTRGPMTSKKAHYFMRESSRKLYAIAMARRINNMPEKIRQAGSV